MKTKQMKVWGLSRSKWQNLRAKSEGKSEEEEAIYLIIMRAQEVGNYIRMFCKQVLPEMYLFQVYCLHNGYSNLMHFGLCIYYTETYV